MRHGKVCAVLAVLVAAGCSSPSKPMKDMVGYVPPTSLPAQPKRTLVADQPEQVWNQLVSFLEASSFNIDHMDAEEKLLVARYSGDPKPFIDCGSIVTHQNGSLSQIAGSEAAVSLNYEIEAQPVILNRSLNLDSRIIIRLYGQPQGTVINTDTTYVVTKTVDVEAPSGATREGSRETVSFQAGGRGEFGKGTSCQPNGSLDLAVLESLPNIIGSDDIDRADLRDEQIAAVDRGEAASDVFTAPKIEEAPLETADSSPVAQVPEDVEQLDAATTPPPANDDAEYQWELPETGIPTAALPAPKPATPNIAPTESEPSNAQDRGSVGQGGTEPKAVETAAATPSIPPSDNAQNIDESPTTIVDDTTRKLLASLDCRGDEWHFCDLVEITTPYRKRNIEELLGLTINTTESFTSQVVGRDLKLDILFPSFPSHLHIAYARRDGTVEHIISSEELWPADQSEQLNPVDRTIPGPAGLAMIVAIASDEPLFSSPPDDAEDAATYLDRLKQRLAELEAATPQRSVAASQLLIYVEDIKT